MVVMSLTRSVWTFMAIGTVVTWLAAMVSACGGIVLTNAGGAGGSGGATSSSTAIATSATGG
jgi:hypothetical protein